MLIPPKKYADMGYKAWCVGDDIAWLRIGPDGRLWAVNPEYGFFGVAPGTNAKSNPNALATTRKNTIFTNVVQNLEDNTVWWEKLDKNPPKHALNWKGEPWDGSDGTPGWFRTDDEGNFLWPGFGDNMRVLLWILARCEGKVSARETEIGYLPYVKDIDIEGLENDGKEFTHMMLDELLSVDKALWREDAENIEGFYTSIGERLPAKLWEELETLKKNLE